MKPNTTNYIIATLNTRRVSEEEINWCFYYHILILDIHNSTKATEAACWQACGWFIYVWVQGSPVFLTSLTEGFSRQHLKHYRRGKLAKMIFFITTYPKADRIQNNMSEEKNASQTKTEYAMCTFFQNFTFCFVYLFVLVFLFVCFCFVLFCLFVFLSFLFCFVLFLML